MPLSPPRPRLLLALLASLLVLGSSCAGCTGCAEEQEEQSEAASEPTRRWTLLYYLPYDNDLSPKADLVLSALVEGMEGMEGDRVAIAAQVDRFGNAGMERLLITGQGRESSRIPEEGSAQVQSLREFLDWAQRELPARRYALFLLNHGGALDEYGLDLVPTAEPPSLDGDAGDEGTAAPAAPAASWMRFTDTAAMLADREREQHRQPLSLLFLQQCGRGTLETLSLFSERAEVLVSSQGVVGAPNAYYGQMLRLLRRYPEAGGEELARFAISYEEPQMFLSYTAMRGEALGALPARLDESLSPLLRLPHGSLDAERAEANVRRSERGAVPFRYGGESYEDLFALLHALYAAQELDPAPIRELARYFEEEVVVYRRVSPGSDASVRTWSGLSLHFPWRHGRLLRHEELPIYRQARLLELHRRLLPAPHADVAE